MVVGGGGGGGWNCCSWYPVTRQHIGRVSVKSQLGVSWYIAHAVFYNHQRTGRGAGGAGGAAAAPVGKKIVLFGQRHSKKYFII